jgi:signal transduction histidine kinase
MAPDTPFLCVSGSMGEEMGRDAMRRGATDFVPKQNLSRLGPAIRRALAERAERHRRQHAEAAIAGLDQDPDRVRRLEAVARMAGGLAHDFNNLLMVIHGGCERLLTNLADGDPLRGDVEVIQQSALRAGGLSRQLLACGRRQPPASRPLDLNVIVGDLVRLLERAAGDRIAVLTSLEAASPVVEADPGQIEQVLMNLTVNARDAMPEGGTISIATTDLIIGADTGSAPHGWPPGRYVQLTVTDTGHGMDASTAVRAFEPFFTTKPQGQGTGLGLATVADIVTGWGGHIAVESQPGRGTVMRLVLPCAEGGQPAPDEALVDPSSRDIPTTLMVVEDEEFIRDLVREFLEAAGYRVLEAATAEDALDLAEHARIDLLITDVVLPGMNGAALARLLVARIPGLATLYMSGYPGDTLFDNGSFSPGDAFLPKPFTRQLLIEKVREVLDQREMVAATAVASDGPPSRE